MADLVAVGAGIEGSKLQGQSRNPLRSIAPAVENDEIVYRFQADHDVSANITQAANSCELCEDASLDPSDTVKCERAIVKSKSAKFKQEVAQGSGRHKTNRWRFSDRACVDVIAGHHEIMEAMRKREETGKLTAAGASSDQES